MKKILLALLLLCFVASTGCNANHVSKIKIDSTWIKVPNEWIEMVHNYDFKQSNKSLITEFESFIKPDSLEGQKNVDNLKTAYINPIFVNLDDDKNEELIALIGLMDSDPTLAVFKQVNNNWYVIYKHKFYIFYVEPQLIVANNFSKDKTFYLKCIYDRGSGIYRDAYHFYKLINGKVHPCLELINESRISGWGLFLNQDINMKFDINSIDKDEIWVKYDYNFFPGVVMKGDVPWDDHKEIPFVKNSGGISYQWDTTTFTYKPEFYEPDQEPNNDYLTADKVACFGDFGNDSLFVRAYKYEINETLKSGTKIQKKLLKRYIELVNNSKKWGGQD